LPSLPLSHCHHCHTATLPHCHHCHTAITVTLSHCHTVITAITVTLSHCHIATLPHCHSLPHTPGDASRCRPCPAFWRGRQGRHVAALWRGTAACGRRPVRATATATATATLPLSLPLPLPLPPPLSHWCLYCHCDTAIVSHTAAPTAIVSHTATHTAAAMLPILILTLLLKNTPQHTHTRLLPLPNDWPLATLFQILAWNSTPANCHNLSTATTCQLPQPANCRNMPTVTTCQLPQHANCHNLTVTTFHNLPTATT
jgi:hypothetical protein